MKLLLPAVLVLTAAGAKWASNRKDVAVKKFDDASCSAATESWKIQDATSPLFHVCTAAIKNSGGGGGPDTSMAPMGQMPQNQNQGPPTSMSIGDLTLAKLRRIDQGMQLMCVDGAYKMAVYDDPMSCSTAPLTQESFAVDQSSVLAKGGCAKTTTGTAYQIDLGSISLLDCDIISSSSDSSTTTTTTSTSTSDIISSSSTSSSNTTSTSSTTATSSSTSSNTTSTSSKSSSESSGAGVIGDPHLTNIRGERFDIHDGLHRLVHYPRGASKEEALFMVDARAVDMGKTKDCYSVYLDSIKISGKWVGDEISFSSHANASEAGLNPSAFLMSFASESMDWPTLAKLQDAHLKLKGSMPVSVTPGIRNASGDDPAGGQELTLKIGEQHPVLVQVWSSYAFNALTHGQQVGYLNVQVKNLPASAGGIIGLDGYSRPSNAQCELVQEERDLLDDITAEAFEVNLLRIKRPRWTALATTQEQ